MTKIEKALAALKAKGVNTTATKWETISAKLVENGIDPDNFSDDFVVSDDLLKIITDDKNGKAFSSKELQEELKADKEREYPDFGRDIPEGEYILTGYATAHDWKSPRDGRISHIRTAFITNGTDVYELPFANLSAKEWPFVQFNGRNSDGKATYKTVEIKTVLPYYSSVADRNFAVTQIPANTKIKVHHARGHYDNPYNTRVFDFKNTWAELA